ncbi:MAG: 50S ribosomal protein L25/general stress protein Ctc [Gammaproteobacteria bacterium]|nr:50S ribosomal protein L25/general stress protein Ctc [Gammaproteobacteria bacterium]
MENFELNAEARDDMGKGASRRLRRAGKFPAIVYGSSKAPRTVAVNHNEMLLHLQNEAFYSHVLTLNVAGAREQVVLKDMQRHPSHPTILHADFLRVDATHKLTMQVPIHFTNEDKCPGRKLSNGLIQHHITDLEISCLAKDLPEFIEVDLGTTEVGDIIQVGDVQLPEGVELTPNTVLEQPVVSVTQAMAEEVDEEEGEEGGEAGGEAEGESEPDNE